MRIMQLVACLVTLTASAASAQQSPLQAVGRSDFEGSFGTSVVPGLTFSDELRSALTSENIDLLTSLRTGMAGEANATSTDSNVLLNILKGGDVRRYYFLWHLIALDASALDHASEGMNNAFFQVGPARTARALALAHQALYEAALVFDRYEMNSEKARFSSTLPDLELSRFSQAISGLSGAQLRATQASALTEAAYETLVWLYPNLRERRLASEPPQLPEFAAFSLENSLDGPRLSEAYCEEQAVLSLRNYYLCALDTIDAENFMEPTTAGSASAEAKVSQGALSPVDTPQPTTVEDTIKDARELGARIGRAIASEIRRTRENDGANHVEPEFALAPGSGQVAFQPAIPAGTPNREFLQWLKDPVSKVSTALGARWPQVAPFALASAHEFRPGEANEPRKSFSRNASLDEKIRKAEELKSYEAVEKFGCDWRINGGGARECEATKTTLNIAQFWAYDGTAYLCAPARMYNQIALAVLDKIAIRDEGDDLLKGRDTTAVDDYAYVNASNTLEIARYFALINFALADAALAAWDAKYYFQTPRPVTYIRAVHELKRQKHQTDGGNSLPLWYPAGAQTSNADSPVNITPPFPSYVSGHAAFGGALFGILRQFAEPNTEFEFKSDEFNGRNKDAFNYIRCEDSKDENTEAAFCDTRKFTLDCAERENADSRIWMGVHWIQDADDGITMGNQVAEAVYTKMMTPPSGFTELPPFSINSETYSWPLEEGKVQTDRSDLLCNTFTKDDGLALPVDWETKFGPLEYVLIKQRN